MGVLYYNLTNPTLLFFFLGILAVRLKSDLVIPESSFKFISLYLLFAIGFKGGQELTHSVWSLEIFWSIVTGVLIASLIPLYTFFILKRRLDISNSGAIAASYGSVSAVTFVAVLGFLEQLAIKSDGHMVAVMAFMEFPAIIVGVLLVAKFNQTEIAMPMRQTIKHSFSNGSVLMLMGSLVIGIVADEKQALDIKPFTTDMFKGFLALFLLEMGMTTAKRFKDFVSKGWFAVSFAIIIPILNGVIVALMSVYVTDSIGNRLIFSILAASASYIAVPAAMRLAVPNANPGLYIPMALGITFPINITIGMPLYFYLISLTA